MAERSFAREVEDLRLGAGAEFRGEGILAITKALLQSGVAYVGGYQGAPISHLMDVLSDAAPYMRELGVHFESSASEAAAAAMLSASIMYPIRGAVTWKSTAGTNVASDALSNLASSGVTGGAVIVIGEDYGEGSSIMQERSHAFAMKSQIWLADPRPNLPSMVHIVEKSFELSEASNTPVMVEVRIRACHVHGRFIAKDNRKPTFTLKQALENPLRDVDRIVLPPASFSHEKLKIEKRWPAAQAFIREHRLNEHFGPKDERIGIILQGGMYNGVIRGLEQLGLSDVYGETRVPLYVLNITYPLVDEEVAAFCAGKTAVLIVEEGQPDFIEQAINTILRRRDINTRLMGKDVLPLAGEYTATVMQKGLTAFLEASAPRLLRNRPPLPDATPILADPKVKALAETVPPRPPGFCIGCPERPIFAAMKLVEKELGPHHVSADIGCHLFSILPPFNIGATTMGYGLGPAAASAFNIKAEKRVVSVMGDGGFWHNGLASSIGNAVFNRHDGVILLVDNYYSAATGGQDILSSRALNPARHTNNSIADAAHGVGAKWVRQIDRTYDVSRMRDTLKEALITDAPGPKVIVASSECMLNKQRREKPLIEAAKQRGERVVKQRFGVDEDICTGDHACIRLSGCPSLSLKHSDDPLKDDPVATVDNSCVGCGNCGEVADAAVLCPSFYRADIIHNPTRRDRFLARLRRTVISFLQRRSERADFSSPRVSGEKKGPIAQRWEDEGHPGHGAQDPGAPRLPHAAHGSPSSPRSRGERTTIAIMALGGQGGGVLADWIVAAAEASGWQAQSTSVPGVAQRTGATLYYIEMLPARAGRTPVFALMPTPGDVDVVIAAELMEAGRAILRGLVTPDKTLLITSTHRAYAVAETEKPGDAIADPQAVAEAVRANARRVIAFDFDHAARKSGTALSAPLLGALAATGVLPFPRAAFEEAIKSGGKGVDASLHGFAEGFSHASENHLPRLRRVGPKLFSPLPADAGDAALNKLVHRIRAFPEPLHSIIFAGVKRVVRFQDAAYGADYLDRLDALRTLDDPARGHAFTAAVAKHLANALAYDDVIGVADAKTRSSRFTRIENEIGVKKDAPYHLTEFLHPRAEELVGLLPAKLGKRVSHHEKWMRRIDRVLNRGRRIRTTTLRGFLQLHLLATLRPWRRKLFRHAEEMAHVERWLSLARSHVASNYGLAEGIIVARRLIKGYSDTHARGLSKFDRVLSAVPMLAQRADAGDWMKRLIAAALKDENGEALDGALKTVRSLDHAVLEKVLD